MSLANELFDLTGKVAVVTGGSRGIGRSIAGGLAAAGADVVIASRKLDACERSAEEIHEATGRRMLAVGFHVGHWDECSALVDQVYEEFGRCDVLVNNAGMSPLYESVAGITEEYFDKVVSVNFKGPFRLSAAFGARMADTDGGSIINVSTMGSLRPDKRDIVYASAKAALNALTIGIADTYAPSVRSNCILPGPVLTDITKAWGEKQIESLAGMVPLGRAGQPDDYVGTALWLASEASAFVTGAMIHLDGGLFLQT